MIVRDNEATVEACLDSVRPWVDEMIVVDTGSTDRTSDIVPRFGVRHVRESIVPVRWPSKAVDAAWTALEGHPTAGTSRTRTCLRQYGLPWCDDFSAARNDSLKRARGEWIFWIDFDETIDARNGQKLRELAYGAFTYSPDIGFAGTDSFTYYLSDGMESSNTATVTITVNQPTSSNSAPVAADDYSYSVDAETTLIIPASGVLANDTDADGDPLTAVLDSSTYYGTVTLNADGSFTYSPSTGFTGSDSFTYYATDGTDSSSTETVTLDVTKPFGPQTNLPDQPAGDASMEGVFATSRQTGDVLVSHTGGSGHTVLYTATSNAQPIVVVETTFSTMLDYPDQIEARLTLGGVAAGPIFYGGSSLMPESEVRFAIQADASSLSSGRFAYELQLISHYGSNTATQTFSGFQDVVNLADSEFGAGWKISDLDSLVAGAGGVLLVRGVGTTAWFADNGDGTFASPAGPLSSSTLVQNADDTYSLISKRGNRSEFFDSGLLTARIDQNNNTTSYVYTDADNDGQTDELSQIADAFGRATTFAYAGGGFWPVSPTLPDGRLLSRTMVPAD